MPKDDFLIKNRSGIHVARQDNTFVARPIVKQLIPMTGGGGASKHAIPNIVENDNNDNVNYVSNIVKDEMKNTRKSFTKADVQYWSKIIAENSRESGIPPEILSAIIAVETKFEKNIDCDNGAGPMQVVSITLKDMFSDKEGRLNLYNKIDSDMMNKILYECDSSGKPIMDKKGEPVRKYKSVAELRKACAKDDNLAIKAGIMCLKMNYVNAVSNYTGLSLKGTIAAIKNKKIKLSLFEQQKVLTSALKSYNSVFKTYSGNVVSRIKDSNEKAISMFLDSLQDKNNSFSTLT